MVATREEGAVDEISIIVDELALHDQQFVGLFVVHAGDDFRLDRVGFCYTSLTKLYLRYMHLAREYEGNVDDLL